MKKNDKETSDDENESVINERELQEESISPSVCETTKIKTQFLTLEVKKE